MNKLHVETSSEFEDAYHDEREFSHAIFAEILGHVSHPPTVTVQATATISEAIQHMNEHRTGCTLVLRDGKLAGIFTERDVLLKVAGQPIDTARTTVDKVMTPNPETLPAGCPLAYALRKMVLEGYRHIPLVDTDGKPVGLVSQRDIVTWMVEHFPHTVLNLPPEPHAYPQTVDGG